MNQQTFDFQRLLGSSFTKRPREGGQMSEVTQRSTTLIYPSAAAEGYCFSVQPSGYQVHVEISIKFGRGNIDVEAVHSNPTSDLDHAREAVAFTKLLPSLIPTRLGWFVAIFGGEVIDQDRDEIALAKRIEETHRREFVLIRQVASGERTDYLRSPKSEFS